MKAKKLNILNLGLTPFKLIKVKRKKDESDFDYLIRAQTIIFKHYEMAR